MIKHRESGGGIQETEPNDELPHPPEQTTILSGEQEILRTIPKIEKMEVIRILSSEAYISHIFRCNEVIRTTHRGGEAGFVVIRDLQTGEHHFSLNRSTHISSVDTQNIEFPTFPDTQRNVLETQLPGMKTDPGMRDDWNCLETLNTHFHPIADGRDVSDWFEASFMDLKSLSGDTAMNGVKLRVKSGLPAFFLRWIDDPSQTSDAANYIKELRKHYGYFMKFGAPFKRPKTEVDSIEGGYRPYASIAMSLSATKVAVVVLHDNPLKDDLRPQENAFESISHDLEEDAPTRSSILDYYDKRGFDAMMIFYEKQEDGTVRINSFE